MHQDDPALGGLPAPGEPVFYPKVGHCVYRGVTEDRAAPGKKLVELEDLEEGSRILIPTERVPNLGLRPAGRSLDEIQEELSSEFEPTSLAPEEDGELDIEALINDGSPRNLAKGLKRLHLVRQTTGLSREEEQTRRKIRSWLAAEVALSKDCTRAEAQAFITRILQEAMNAHRRKEREEAKERRRQVKAQKAAEDAEVAATQQGLVSGTEKDQPGPPSTEATVDESEAATPPTESVEATREEHGSSPNETAESLASEETDTPPDAPSLEPPLQYAQEEVAPGEESERTESAASPGFDDSSETPSDEASVDSDPRDRESAESS